MTSITEPTITHPAWCEPDECSSEVLSGELISVTHGTAATTWASAETRGGRLEAETYVVAIDHYDDEPDQGAAIYARIGGETVVSPDQLEALAAWLTERAAEYRRIIAAAGGAR